MVTYRLKASSSIKYKKTVNIVQDNVPYACPNAYIISLAPELSLSTIGELIPIIEIPEDAPCLPLQELAYVLRVAGSMVAQFDPPSGPIKADATTIYKKGKTAWAANQEILYLWGKGPQGSGARGSQS